MIFPVFKTKTKGVSKKFNLSDPKERKIYFEKKAGREIEILKNYLENNTFICYLLGKKNSGKGTYAKMFSEIIGPEKVSHFSIGDLVREVHQIFLDNKKDKEQLMEFLEKNYRGFISLDDAISKLLNRGIKTLLPTEFILSLVKWKISELTNKALFIDGFPRDLDQVSFALFYRDLIGHRSDPDVFVLIKVPTEVIDMRMKYRVICPKCNTPRNLKLLRTNEIGYDEDKNEFYLICDNCKERMVPKEGDILGIDAIKERLEKDEELFQKVLSLHGVPKVYLRNSVPVKLAKDYVDDYEITPEYEYHFDKKTKKVKVVEKPLIVHDDDGNLVYSLLPEPVVVSLIKQLAKILSPEDFKSD